MTTEAELNNGKNFGGGLGLFIHNNRGITEIEHGGADAGFRAQLSMFPSQGLGIIVLSNDAQCNAHMMVSKVADLYLDNILATYTSREEKQRKPIKLEPKTMEPFVGHYWTKTHAYTRKIYLKNDTLMHFRTENNESPLAPIGKNEFQVMDVPVDALIRFENHEGEIRLIETVNGGEPILLEKFVPVQYTSEDWLKYEGMYYSDELKTVYEITWRNDKLIAKHMRMGIIELSMLKHNYFAGNRGFFGNVEFVRDSAEQITGFKVSNGRVRNLLFEKQHAEVTRQYQSSH